METTPVRVLLEVDVLPAPGQSLGDAAVQMREKLKALLESRDYGFWDDFGGRPGAARGVIITAAHVENCETPAARTRKAQPADGTAV